MAVTEYCWLRWKVPVPVEDGGQESSGDSWGEAMARTRWVVGHATSMPLDACESPAQACARSVECDELYRSDKASMILIVAESQATVQAFYVPHRSGGLSLTDGALMVVSIPILRRTILFHVTSSTSSSFSRGISTARNSSILRERSS